jgi:hypothetical protein
MNVFNLAHCEDPRFHTAWIVGADAALYVNVENPLGEVDDALRTLLQGTIEQQALVDGAPAAIARAIDAALSQGARNSSLPQWVFYSAVLASPTRVECCVAGPHRVHLARDSALFASTREHVLRHDQAPPDWSTEARASVDLAVQGNIVTRSLGDSISLPPETTIWNTQAPYNIVVCSADAHQERAPSSYAASLDTRSALAAWSCNVGSVAVIECL